ncbi:MAG: CsgG/HfaB family protein [Syntrophaceae bacterium]
MKPVGDNETASLLYIDSVIQSISGNEITLSYKIPDLKKTPGSPISEIAQQVVQKSILVEGIQTEVDGKPATVKTIRGNTAIVELEKPAVYQVGAHLKLMLPKKTIAVVDFEVIRGRDKEAGRVSLEELTSALIDSGQFIVLERSKLKSVMNEIELSLSGLAKETSDKVAGKLLIADLILAGTFAEVGNEWNINLRLINVRSGQATAAIALKTPLLASSDIRDSGTMKEDFEEQSTDPSWILMKTGKDPYFRSSIDRSTGAQGSKRSLRIDFSLIAGKRPIWARIENRKKRDLSLYDGIEFYVKSTEKMYASVTVMTSHPDNPNKIDLWVGGFETDKNWEKIKVPFKSMTVARGWIQGGAKSYGAELGDQVMRLHKVEAFEVGVDVRRNSDIKGTLWVDKINFYRD